MKTKLILVGCAFAIGFVIGRSGMMGSESVEKNPVIEITEEAVEQPAPVKVLANESSRPVQKPAKVAIVLDDWGHHLEALPMLQEMSRPVTLAVLPNLVYTRHVAEEAYARGHEIILHMPMEPKGNMRLEKDTIYNHMAPPEAGMKLTASLQSVPYAVGISNHMGSKVSENPMMMDVVMETLSETGYFYLDSLTTEQSVVAEAAASWGLPFLTRDVFLDNEMTEAAIQARLDELRVVAKAKGFAIGIGHDKAMTLIMISRNIDIFEKDGIEFIKLSQLLEDYDHAGD